MNKRQAQFGVQVLQSSGDLDRAGYSCYYIRNKKTLNDSYIIRIEETETMEPVAEIYTAKQFLEFILKHFPALRMEEALG